MTEQAEQKVSAAGVNTQAYKLATLKAIQQAVYEKLKSYQELVQEIKRDEPAVTAAVQACQTKLQSAGNANEEELKALREEFIRVETMLSQAVQVLRNLQGGYATLKAMSEQVASDLQAAEASIASQASSQASAQE